MNIRKNKTYTIIKWFTTDDIIQAIKPCNDRVATISSTSSFLDLFFP